MFRSGRRKVISCERLYAINLRVASLAKLKLFRRKWMIEFSVPGADANLMQNLLKSISLAVCRETKVKENDYCNNCEYFNQYNHFSGSVVVL
jgi:hypothetical protein